MGKKTAQNTPFQPGDHNQPTEPMERIVLPYVPSPYPVNDAFPDSLTVPAPQPDARPFPPHEARPAYPYYQQPQQSGAAYPVLPPSPASPGKRYRGSPPGGSAPAYSAAPRRIWRRSPIPGLVRLVLVLIQLTLLARVVCMILNVQSTTTWLTLLYAASDLFVQPMRWLAANVNISLLAGTAFLTYLEFLLAMLAYAILSRLLVGLLRILLN